MRMGDSFRPAPILLALICLLAPLPTSAFAPSAFALAAPEDAPVAALSSAYAGAACGRDLPQRDDSERSTRTMSGWRRRRTPAPSPTTTSRARRPRS